MKLTRLAIDNYRFTIILTILLTVFGIRAYSTMPRTEDPPVVTPVCRIIVIYPGTSPIDLEGLVADPIEEAVNELDDLKELKTIIKDGLVVMNVEFEPASDPDDKYAEVVQKVNAIQSDLPKDIYDMKIKKMSTLDTNILQLAIVSETAPLHEMKAQAEQLKKGFKKITGIWEVEIWGAPEREVLIRLDLEKAAQLKIPLMQIAGIIQAGSRIIPGGHIDAGKKRFNIQTSGDYKSLADIGSTIIHTDGQRLIYLRDVADVLFDDEDQTYYTRYNRKRAVFLTANMKKDANIFKVMEQLKFHVMQFSAALPQSMRIHFIMDQSENVKYRVNGFVSNLIQGILLVGVFVFLAVGGRASMVVMLAIPLSFIIGLGFVDLSGYGLQQASIVGLVIALGLLVDNAIVVIENISRYLKMGYSQRQAALKGTGQISLAIISSTVTTLLAFVPIIMMENEAGEFIRAMPVAVVYTLTASLVIALTMTPFLSYKFLKAPKEGEKHLVERVLAYVIEGPYRRLLDIVLRYPKLTLGVSFAALLASLGLFLVVGVSFFPKAEKPELVINVDTPVGTSLDATDRVVRKIELFLNRLEHVKHFASSVGRDNPRIYYNIFPREQTSNRAQIYVTLNSREPQAMKETVSALRSAFGAYPNARIAVKEFEQGPPVAAPIEFRLIGQNLEVLRKISLDVEDIIVKTPGTINVSNPLRTTKTDIRVNINRDKAGIYGVQLIDIDRTVRMALTGLEVGEFRDDDGESYSITMKMAAEDKPAVSDFARIYVPSAIGAQIPLKQVAKIEFETGLSKVDHFNLDRTVIVTADVLDNDAVDGITKKIARELAQYKWPEGYTFQVGGILESRRETFSGMGKATVIAIISIFGVLVFQFRSFTQPLIIYAAVPLAFIGSIIALYLNGYTFSFTAFIGLTSLVGIVINDSILLVDYANQLLSEGYELEEAVKTSGETRFVPVFLTSVTTIGGLLPLTLYGGTLWSPMGWTIIGGLVASTLLILVIVPVLYRMFTRQAEDASA